MADPTIRLERIDSPSSSDVQFYMRGKSGGISDTISPNNDHLKKLFNRIKALAVTTLGEGGDVAHWFCDVDYHLKSVRLIDKTEGSTTTHYIPINPDIETLLNESLTIFSRDVPIRNAVASYQLPEWTEGGNLKWGESILPSFSTKPHFSDDQLKLKEIRSIFKTEIKPESDPDQDLTRISLFMTRMKRSFESSIHPKDEALLKRVQEPDWLAIALHALTRKESSTETRYEKILALLKAHKKQIEKYPGFFSSLFSFLKTPEDKTSFMKQYAADIAYQGCSWAEKLDGAQKLQVKASQEDPILKLFSLFLESESDRIPLITHLNAQGATEASIERLKHQLGEETSSTP